MTEPKYDCGMPTANLTCQPTLQHYRVPSYWLVVYDPCLRRDAGAAWRRPLWRNTVPYLPVHSITWHCYTAGGARYRVTYGAALFHYFVPPYARTPVLPTYHNPPISVRQQLFALLFGCGGQFGAMTHYSSYLTT